MNPSFGDETVLVAQLYPSTGGQSTFNGRGDGDRLLRVLGENGFVPPEPPPLSFSLFSGNGAGLPLPQGAIALALGNEES